MTRIYWIIAFLLVAIATAAAAWLYSSLPDQIPTHWNIRGEVDGYGGKWTLFAFPVMMVGNAGSVLLPAGACRPSIRGRYVSLDVSLYHGSRRRPVRLHGRRAVVRRPSNCGEATDRRSGPRFLAGLFLFFALMGNVMGKVRKNFYIGVRVPWTLASDRVWNDTHRLAAWVMVAAGVIGFAMIVLGAPILAAFAVLIVSAFIPVIYSFVHYKSLERRGAL